MKQDREGIGLTMEGQRRVDFLLNQSEWFSEGQDAARFCLSFAIAQDEPRGDIGSTETRWSIGLFDRTGELRSLVQALYPEVETPVKLMNYLVDRGLAMVEDEIANNGRTPNDLIALCQKKDSVGL